MLTRILYAPVLLAALIFLYLVWEDSPDYYWPLLICTLLFMAIYMLSPQINWWWYKYYPPDLPDGFRHMLNTKIPFYQNLPPEEKKRFRNRVALYIKANEFTGKGMEGVPMDIKGAVAASVVQLTFGLEDYRLSKFGNIVIYAHPFPSPQYPESWHASEIFVDDGVILFSAGQLVHGFFEPKAYFHLGLYEYAKVFKVCYPDLKFPVFGSDMWENLELISGYSREKIENWIGLTDIDVVAVAIAHFFVFPERFRKVLPEEYAALALIFKQQP